MRALIGDDIYHAIIAQIDPLKDLATTLAQEIQAKRRVAQFDRESGKGEDARKLYIELNHYNPDDPEFSSAMVEIVLDDLRKGVNVPPAQIDKARKISAGIRDDPANKDPFIFWTAQIQVLELSVAMHDLANVNDALKACSNHGDPSDYLIAPGVPKDAKLRGDDPHVRRAKNALAVALAKRYLAIYHAGPEITVKPTFDYQAIAVDGKSYDLFITAGAPEGIIGTPVENAEGDPVVEFLAPGVFALCRCPAPICALERTGAIAYAGTSPSGSSEMNRLHRLLLLLPLISPLLAEQAELAPATVTQNGGNPTEGYVETESITTGITFIVGDPKDAGAAHITYKPGTYAVSYKYSSNRDLLTAEADEHTGKNDAAIEAYALAATTARYDWERQAAYLDEARAAEAAKHFDVAAKALLEFIRLYPTSISLPKVMYQLGHEQVLAGDRAGAVRTLKQLSGHAQDWGVTAAVMGSLGLAETLVADSKPADAIAELKSSCARRPAPGAGQASRGVWPGRARARRHPRQSEGCWRPGHLPHGRLRALRSGAAVAGPARVGPAARGQGRCRQPARRLRPRGNRRCAAGSRPGGAFPGDRARPGPGHAHRRDRGRRAGQAEAQRRLSWLRFSKLQWRPPCTSR